jgi:hypothetical protein
MGSNFVGNTEENRIAALLDSRWLQRTERNGSGYIKGTITVTQDVLPYQTVPAHRFISMAYSLVLPCHSRGRGFESRRPRHIFK